MLNISASLLHRFALHNMRLASRVKIELNHSNIRVLNA